MKLKFIKEKNNTDKYLLYKNMHVFKYVENHNITDEIIIKLQELNVYVLKIYKERISLYVEKEHPKIVRQLAKLFNINIRTKQIVRSKCGGITNDAKNIEIFDATSYYISFNGPFVFDEI
jgi:hypothetical protein